MRRMMIAAIGAQSTHGALRRCADSAQGVIGGIARARPVPLGALDPDCSTWLALVAAFTNPAPAGRPQRIGRLAALGLLTTARPSPAAHPEE